MAKCCAKIAIHRYKPPTENALRVRWWDNSAGPHLDPLLWTGSPDPVSGFPLPSATAPVVNTTTTLVNSINDNNTGGGAMRYGILEGWVWLPDDTTHIRETNANTGELGMVLFGNCCGGGLAELAGGNHDTNTSGQDRTILDEVPFVGGWHYIYSPQSDSGAFQGWDLEYSTDNRTTWQNVTVFQVGIPEIESKLHQSCKAIPEGWSIQQPKHICQPTWGGLPAVPSEGAITGGSVEPSLPEAGRKLVSDNFQDQQFVPFNLQVRNASNAVVNWEAFLENVPYSLNPATMSLNGATLVSSQNADGTWNHLFSGSNLAGFANITITGPVVSPFGDGSGLSLYCEVV